MAHARLRFVHLAPLLAALFVTGWPGIAGAAADLAPFFADPAYAFAATCDLTQPLVFLNVNVANRGNAASVSASAIALDAAGVLVGSPTTLPALAPGAQTALRIPLRFVASSLGAIAGAHAITVVLGIVRERSITVTVPAAFCAGSSLPAAGSLISQRARGVIAPASAGLSQIGHAQTDTAKIILESRTPASPSNVRVASGASDCVQHVGPIGALLCPDMIRSGNMLVVWDWQPGSGPDHIDGFRTYRVDGGRRLIDTRLNKNDVTLADVPAPPGGYPGTCYAVSAFAASFESPLSPPLCPTRQQTIVGASPTVVPPTPAPRPPIHVVIHVTADAFPMDTVVAAGGDVTWINDDGDEHTVYGAGGSFGGDLYPRGGRYTATFLNTNNNKPYIAAYVCELHQGMIGRITVIP